MLWAISRVAPRMAACSFTFVSVLGFEFWVWGFWGLGVWGLGVGCWVLVVGCWLLVVGCWVLGFGVWGLGLQGARKRPHLRPRVYGLRLKVEGFNILLAFRSHLLQRVGKEERRRVICGQQLQGGMRNALFRV